MFHVCNHRCSAPNVILLQYFSFVVMRIHVLGLLKQRRNDSNVILLLLIQGYKDTSFSSSKPKGVMLTMTTNYVTPLYFRTTSLMSAVPSLINSDSHDLTKWDSRQHCFLFVSDQRLIVNCLYHGCSQQNSCEKAENKKKDIPYKPG